MKLDTQAVAATLNEILEFELAGTVRNTHYSLMTYGYNRIPIVKWLNEQAAGSILVEEYARQMIGQEEQHLGEVDKMLRKPGDIEKAGA